MPHHLSINQRGAFGGEMLHHAQCQRAGAVGLVEGELVDCELAADEEGALVGDEEEHVADAVRLLADVVVVVLHYREVAPAEGHRHRAREVVPVGHVTVDALPAGAAQEPETVCVLHWLERELQEVDQAAHHVHEAGPELLQHLLPLGDVHLAALDEHCPDPLFQLQFCLELVLRLSRVPIELRHARELHLPVAARRRPRHALLFPADRPAVGDRLWHTIRHLLLEASLDAAVERQLRAQGHGHGLLHAPLGHRQHLVVAQREPAPARSAALRVEEVRLVRVGARHTALLAEGLRHFLKELLRDAIEELDARAVGAQEAQADFDLDLSLCLLVQACDCVEETGELCLCVLAHVHRLPLARGVALLHGVVDVVQRLPTRRPHPLVRRASELVSSPPHS
mmetsp:Transcript_18931/g.72952  ORF Transcript_18931/g.72952 Transcript_18931/m.72952 type:complete len:397 (-) Transcript_18931:85-1275(-)